jgi:hypothetical protein
VDVKMSAAVVEFTTKELSERTWDDYHRFFTQGNGWDHCGCMAYHGGRTHSGAFPAQRDANLEAKRDLLERGLAHGILVYAGREPVGWCQFGPRRELPLQRTSAAADDGVWRITCFCTMKAHREQGVAEVALGAALHAIRAAGGGTVEARPVVTMPNDPQLDRLVREHGGVSKQVLARAKRQYGATDVVAYDRRAFSVGGVSMHGLGPLWALVRRVGGVLHPGTVAMFEKHRFTATGVVDPTSRKLPSSRLVMERRVRAAR